MLLEKRNAKGSISIINSRVNEVDELLVHVLVNEVN